MAPNGNLIASVILVVPLLLLLAGCGGLFFRRNPNLSLIRPGTAGDALNPVWSAGGVIYYTIESHVGQIRAIRPDGSNDRLVLEGDFRCVAVSPDGSKLAAVTGGSLSSSSGGLLLVDTSGRVLDTVESAASSVVAARFGGCSDWLYYLVAGRKFYRADLTSHRVYPIPLTGVEYPDDFDVWRDSLLLASGRIYSIADGSVDTMLRLHRPRFRPSDPSLVLGVQGYADLVEVNRSTGAEVHLDAGPYWSCAIWSASRSPDGQMIALSAARLGRYMELPQPETYELWLLRTEDRNPHSVGNARHQEENE